MNALEAKRCTDILLKFNIPDVDMTWSEAGRDRAMSSRKTRSG